MFAKQKIDLKRIVYFKQIIENLDKNKTLEEFHLTTNQIEHSRFWISSEFNFLTHSTSTQKLDCRIFRKATIVKVRSDGLRKTQRNRVF